MLNIVVDAMGGDNAPSAIIEGAVRAANEFDIKVTLVGDEKIIRQELLDYKGGKIDIVNTTEIIDCNEESVKAIRTKKDSSIVVGMKMVADGAGDAFVSAGSSGAVIAGSSLIIKRINGVRRAGLGIVLPALDKPVLLLDCGANSDCTPEFLTQFAVMGTAYMKSLFDLDKPAVALLNNGAEEHKGSRLYKESYQLLKQTPVNFVGNIEARYVLSGVADVVVADGFAGNVFIKTTEGVAKHFSTLLKGVFKKNIFTMLASLVLLDGIKNMKKSFDYTEYGGAPVLGAEKVVIKAHGSSNSKAIYSAIKQAKNFAENNVIETIKNNLKKSLDE